MGGCSRPLRVPAVPRGAGIGEPRVASGRHRQSCSTEDDGHEDQENERASSTDVGVGRGGELTVGYSAGFQCEVHLKGSAEIIECRYIGVTQRPVKTAY